MKQKVDKEFGIVYNGFQGKPYEAILHLLEKQGGICPKALHRDDIGDIDIAYGRNNHDTNEGYGLKHIVEKHGHEFEAAGVDIAEYIVLIVEQGLKKENRSDEDKIVIEHKGFRAAVSLDWRGDKKKRLLLTAFRLSPNTIVALSGIKDKVNVRSSTQRSKYMKSKYINQKNLSWLEMPDYERQLILKILEKANLQTETRTLPSSVTSNQQPATGTHENLGSLKILNSNEYGPEAYEPTYSVQDFKNKIALGSLKMFSKGTGDIDKVLAIIKMVIGKYAWQVKKLAATLKADTVEQSAFNVWHFMKRIEAGGNINYALDTKGKEEIRTPARTWHDRFIGVDCDDMAIFSACVLLNMGYKPQLYVVAFNNRSSFGHIYTVVDNIVVDGVMKRFNQHPDGITKTRIMALQIEVLDGLGTVPENVLLGVEANEIDATTQELMDEQSELIAEAKANGLTPELRRELRKVRTLIQLNGLEEREYLEDVMPLVRDIDQSGNLVFENPALMGIAGNYLGNILDIQEGAFAGLGATEDLVDEAREAYMAELSGYMAAKELEGLGDLGRLFKRIKKGMKKVGSKIKKVAKKVGSGVKTAAKKTAKFAVKTAKKVGKAIMKFSPLTIAIRSAFRALVALNFLGLATKMHIGSMTQSQAAKEGFSASDWKKFNDSWNKAYRLFEKGGGSKSKLLKSVNTGKKKKALFDKNTNKNLRGLGFTGAEETAALVAASSSLFIPISKYFGNIDSVKKIVDKVKGSGIFKAGKGIKDFAKNLKSKNKGGNSEAEVDFIEDNELDPNSGSNSKTLWYVLGGVAGLSLLFMVLKK